MKRITIHAFAALLAATASLSCSGGGGGGPVTPGPAPSFITSFTPDQPNPGNNSVALSQASGGSSLLTVSVDVTGVNDVFGASFRITYDPALVEFENWSPGSLIEGSGATALYQVSAITPGVVDVGVSCAGCATGIDVGSSSTIIDVIFRAIASGSSALGFVSPDLLDSQSPPGPIAGITWDGGTMTAQ